MRITLKDIADKAQVSTSLVSKVLNNREVRVSGKKREQILRIAEDFGYNSRAEAPSVQYRRKLIALIMPSFEFDFLSKLCLVIQKNTRKFGYDLIILNSNENVEEERRCLEICESCRVSGIILNSCDNHANIESINELRSNGFPLVFVDRYIFDYDCDYVATDNFQGAYKLTNALIEKGHRDILFIFHGKAMFTTVLAERFAGYQAAMSEHGLTSIKEYVYSGRALKYQSLYQMQSGSAQFTGIVLSTSWDFSSLSDILDQMHFENAEHKPEVATFDSFLIPYESLIEDRILERIDPHVTIAKQDVENMGAKVVEILMSRIDKSRNNSENQKILLEPHLLSYSQD